MLVLLHGLFYGRLDQAENPADIVTRYTEGRVDVRYLRGQLILGREVDGRLRGRPVHRLDAFGRFR